MSGSSSGAGAPRALRTRRPFTPRSPQRALLARRRDARPPSGFDLKALSLAERREPAPSGPALLAELLGTTKNKHPPMRHQPRSLAGEGWSGGAGALPRLPRLSGRSKPLHRRHTATAGDDAEEELAQAISITRPLGSRGDEPPPEARLGIGNPVHVELSGKRKQFAGGKSVSSDAAGGSADVAVRHLAVQLPHTGADSFDSMSLLELSEALAERSGSERTLALLEPLQSALERSCPGGARRDLLLRALCTHADSEDERVVAGVARALLTMRVTGSHLSVACKLVFKLARNDKNDHFFRNSNLLELLVEGCGRADPVSEGSCCVLAAGALRVLALEPRLALRARRAGATHLAALHLNLLNSAKEENPRGISEESTHALYQLTGALRNLAGSGAGLEDEEDEEGEQIAQVFVASGALEQLVRALALHTDRDVLTNVARCLSVLSGAVSCCAWLCAHGGAAQALLGALCACAARAPLAVRLAYTLGNMAAHDHQARLDIYCAEGGVDVLLMVLESYAVRGDARRDPDAEPDLHLIGSDLGGSDGSNDDVLIKTVRVLANLCLAERAGRGLARGAGGARAARALLACLQRAERPPGAAESEGCEEPQAVRARRDELATAALAALNNITFYRDADEGGEDLDQLDDTLDLLCKVACRWLRGAGVGADAGGGAACEAARALGNLSRSARAARGLVLEGALDTLPPFLDHEDASVRCSAAGILVNVCGAGAGVRDGNSAGSEAAELATRALCGAAARGDAGAAALLARALWNAHAHAALAPRAAGDAARALTQLLATGRSEQQSSSEKKPKKLKDEDFLVAASEPCAAAPAPGARRASQPAPLGAPHELLEGDNSSGDERWSDKDGVPAPRALSLDQHLDLDLEQPLQDWQESQDSEHLDLDEDAAALPLRDAECWCGACARLAAWDQLLRVAIPLLQLLQPPAAPTRADAAVGPD